MDFPLVLREVPELVFDDVSKIAQPPTTHLTTNLTKAVEAFFAAFLGAGPQEQPSANPKIAKLG